MSDKSKSFLGSARRAEVITPSDSATFRETRAIMVSEEGAVQMLFVDGGTMVTTTLSPGVLYPFAVIAIGEASTPASIIGFW